jgi:hypothetical protein
MIVQRIARGREAGDVPEQNDPQELASFIDVVWAGMSARARDGATREQLLAVATMAMDAWPSATTAPSI